MQGRKGEAILNKEEYVKFILSGTDFKLVADYVINHWDTHHKKLLLHDLVDNFDKDGD